MYVSCAGDTNNWSFEAATVGMACLCDQTVSLSLVYIGAIEINNGRAGSGSSYNIIQYTIRFKTWCVS
jgi:hypothetical protein